MADVAAAPAEAAPAPDPNEIIVPPNPMTEPEPKKAEPKAEDKPKPSLRDTIAKAKEKVEAADDPKALKTDQKAKAEKGAKSEAESSKSTPKSSEQVPSPVKTAERPRGEHGHFTADPTKTAEENETARIASEKAASTPPVKAPASDPTDHKQPLQRFSQAAKDAWPTVPEEAQKEIHRAFREVEAGLTKHRESSTRYGEVFKEFDDIAKASNIDAKATMRGYIAVDRALHSNDPQQVVGAINEVLKQAKLTPQQYAQAILGNQAQPPANGQQQQGQPSREVTELRETVKRLEQKLGGVELHLQGETMTKHEQTLTEWAADKPHFNELRSEVTRLVKDEGLSPDDAYASALVAAQDKARALLGDSALKTPSSKPSGLDAAELDEQIAKGSRSIAGARSSGSSLDAKKPSSSIKESIRKAMQAVG